MVCPHLEYRRSDADHEFDHERPYCALQEAFVSPMKADICSERFDYSHETHCDVYREQASNLALRVHR